VSYTYNVGKAFRAVVRTAGARPALVMPGSVVSYAQLDERVNRLAVELRARGIARRSVVAVVHEKTVDAYAVMLASLKLGAAYVNLDSENPPARLRHILGSAKPALIVGETIAAPIVATASELDIPVLDLGIGDVGAAIALHDPDEPAGVDLVQGSDPAYIMYTSGSTGVPKGAIMTHANVLNFAAWVRERFEITVDDVLTNVNPMYFDNSVFDFYGAMLNGASLAPIPRDTLSDPAAIVARVEEARCTVWFSVPSLLVYLSTMKLLTGERLAGVRTFVFGGEGFPKPELRKFFAAYRSRAVLVNVYGPTECTCICSAWNVGAADLEDETGLVTLGPVTNNFSMLVLNGDSAVAPGEVGELCLLGPQVGLGYVNDPVRTAAAFVANPLNPRWNERMYRTGDLVRLGEDGARLDFVGRKDNQIKHMGYRIELEEIEAALNRLDGVVQSAVLQKTGRRDQKMLIAYVAASAETTEETLRTGLQTFLPPYMIPQRFDIRATLPKNANGKIDRVALAADG